ncbi:MAG TPA: 2,3,4,5-tetrahydropyridine-2,6-dicarboxylate N-succinyltransferase, partial [Thiothrix sp.]|nr:2,3,4,5-tetrahydropyridine-2,6-dicarboxylate N-succinyltransferase [Thiothrix sp.]
MADIQNIIEDAFVHRADITPRTVETHVRDAVNEAIDLLDSGKARVAEPTDNGWQVNEWLKKAVLLSFR